MCLASLVLAGHFVTDVVCGSFASDAHECRERQSFETQQWAENSAHASFLVVPLVGVVSAFIVSFILMLCAPIPLALYLPPPTRPPAPSSR